MNLMLSLGAVFYNFRFEMSLIRTIVLNGLIWISYQAILLFYFSDMYIAAGEFNKAIEILGENGWAEK